MPPLPLLTALLLIGFASLVWFSVVGDLIAWRQHKALDKRGVTTTATVLSYHFDPAGGDPNGWTSDRVRFTTTGGLSVVTTLGHHAPGSEHANRLLAVTYDPAHPRLVRAAGYVDDADSPVNAVVGAALGLLVTVIAGIQTSRVVTCTSSGQL